MYWTARIAAVTLMAYAAWELTILNYLAVFAGAALLESTLCLRKSA